MGNTLSHLEMKQLFPVEPCWVPEAGQELQVEHGRTALLCSQRVQSRQHQLFQSPWLDVGLTAPPLPTHHQTAALQPWVRPWGYLVQQPRALPQARATKIGEKNM